MVVLEKTELLVPSVFVPKEIFFFFPIKSAFRHLYLCKFALVAFVFGSQTRSWLPSGTVSGYLQEEHCRPPRTQPTPVAHPAPSPCGLKRTLEAATSFSKAASSPRN